jgi:phosphopantetheinyl transferase
MGPLVRRYFHRDEVTAWENLGERERVEGFFLLWSAREAAMKCCGLGLAKGLSVTRVDPAFLRGGVATSVVGSMEVTLERIEAPAGYVMVVGRRGG